MLSLSSNNALTSFYFMNSFIPCRVENCGKIANRDLLVGLSVCKEDFEKLKEFFKEVLYE